MSKKNASPASTHSHSYSALSLHDPDDPDDPDDDSNISTNKATTAEPSRIRQNQESDMTESAQGQRQEPMPLSTEGFNKDERRTSIGMDPSSSSSESKPSGARASSRASLQRSGNSESNDDAQHGESAAGEGGVKSTHWSRCWVRYVTLVCILAALVTLIVLLVVKPWKNRFPLAPVNNEAVKALPDEQPVWPIPRFFSYGKERVSLSSNFQIKVEGSATGVVSSYPILEKAITRCMDRLQLKRNTTIWKADDHPSSENTYEATSTLSELVIIVDNAQAILEYGMVESYTLSITDQGSAAGGGGSALLQQEQDALSEAAATAGGAGGAVLRASTQWGVIHGLETFAQLVQATPSTSGSAPVIGQTQGLVENQLQIPNVPWSINDEPKYSHRGILLDTSRNYYPVKDILRTLDAMSVVKLNVFHWHILDQQSYPLVSKMFPNLTAKGAERPDLVYTPDDVSQIIQHAQERGIRVLPEFDSPGHAASWGRSYPNLTVCLDSQPHAKYAAEPPAGQLDPLEPFTYTVLDGLIKEWAAQFPDSQAHIGGDEVNFNCWKTSDRLLDYIKKSGSREEYESALMPTLTSPLEENRMRRTGSGGQSGEDKLLELYLDKALGMFMAQGKRPLVWEEMALEHNVKLPDSAIVQVWKNAANAKRVIEQGRPVILSSAEYWYLDCGSGQWLIGSQGQSWCGYSNWQRVYSYSLTDKLDPAQQKMVYGGEVCMWSEQTDSSNLDPNLWPRSAAAAEVLWSGSQDDQGQDRPLIHAAKRLAAVRDRLVQMGVKAAPIYPSWCRHHPEACLA